MMKILELTASIVATITTILFFYFTIKKRK